MFLAGENRYAADQSSFSKIPGSPVAYWMNQNALRAFENTTLGEKTVASVGIQTGDNERFVHCWWEVLFDDICFSAKKEADSFQEKKHFPYNKGGEFRKWAGNDYYVVWWQNDGEQIKESSLQTGHHYQQYSDDLKFKPLVTWSRITTGLPAFRYKNSGYLSDMAGFCLYSTNTDLRYVAAFCNSSVAAYYLQILAPTLNIMTGQVLALPVCASADNDNRILSFAESCVDLAKDNWDSFENSWGFKRNPLV